MHYYFENEKRQKFINCLLMFCGVLLIISCNTNTKHPTNKINTSINLEPQKKPFIIYTRPSKLPNQYKAFNSPKAINKIAEIENEYFNNYPTSYSKYYGTVWKNGAIKEFNTGDSLSVFDKYLQEMAIKKQTPDSLHCTMYAIEALKAGLDIKFDTLDKYHQKIWKKREYAGWSVGYILTTYFNWKAYLILHKSSSEYKACMKNFKQDKKYHVWKQPNIPIQQVFDFEEDKLPIDSLLKLHEFGWGFSEQGWHTWITRFDTLKECNWAGAPSAKYVTEETKPLFIDTKLTEFTDYNSHIVVFPPKK